MNKLLIASIISVSSFGFMVNAKTFDTAKNETSITTDQANQSEKSLGLKASFLKLKDKSIEKSKVLAESTLKTVSKTTSEINTELQRGVNKTVKMKSAMQTAWNED